MAYTANIKFILISIYILLIMQLFGSTNSKLVASKLRKFNLSVSNLNYAYFYSITVDIEKLTYHDKIHKQ